MDSSPPIPLLNEDGISRLREALTAANYTPSGLRELLGPVATRMTMGDMSAFVEAMESDGPLVTLCRLFRVGQAAPHAAVEAALRPLPLAEATAAGLVEHVDGAIRAKVSLRAEHGWWLVSDPPLYLNPGRGSAFDHVLEFGPSSQLLARATIRRPVETALDLGTGSGAQAVQLSKHAKKVTCTDISARALRFAATTAAINGLEWELLRGDMVEPVSGRQFDLVVFNAPFVVSPGETQQLFRDSGREADDLTAELIAAAPKLLAPGGVMQFLGHWLHVAGEDWTERINRWLTGTGLDALVVETHDPVDPERYVAQWLSTERPAHRPARAATWLDWFKAHNVESIGGGLVTLRNAGHEEPTIRCARTALRTGELGDDLGAWLAACDLSRSLRGPALWDTRLRPAEDVNLFRHSTFGPHGWKEKGQLLAIPRGLGWKTPVDQPTVALLGACDGSAPLREHLDSVAQAAGLDPSELTRSLEPTVRELLEQGILLPAE